MAEVALSGYSELLAAVIRDVPGRTWDKQRREWLVPAAWTADLVVSLGNAAVEVRTTEQRVVICPRCPEPVLAGSPEQHRTRWQESTQPPPGLWHSASKSAEISLLYKP